MATQTNRHRKQKFGWNDPFCYLSESEIEIKLNYAHLLAKGGSCWGQAGGKVLAVRMPVHGPGLAGGKKRNEPTGGAA